MKGNDNVGSRLYTRYLQLHKAEDATETCRKLSKFVEAPRKLPKPIIHNNHLVYECFRTYVLDVSSQLGCTTFFDMNMLQHRWQPAVNLPILRPGPGTSNIPQAPRAMVHRGYSTSGSFLEQIQEVESKKLYPRLALLEALSGFKDKHKPRQRSEEPECEARRNFLDSFAYLCDVQKGGSTVTAAALQRRPYSDFLWLAANEGIRDDIRVYATNILVNLRTATLENKSILQDTIFALAVEKCKPRIQFYRENVQKYATNCRMSLRHREKDDIGMMRL